jgi:hypothetical protein
MYGHGVTSHAPVVSQTHESETVVTTYWISLAMSANRLTIWTLMNSLVTSGVSNLPLTSSALNDETPPANRQAVRKPAATSAAQQLSSPFSFFPFSFFHSALRGSSSKEIVLLSMRFTAPYLTPKQDNAQMRIISEEIFLRGVVVSQRLCYNGEQYVAFSMGRG